MFKNKTSATHEYLAETMNKTVTTSCQITDYRLRF